MVLPTTLVRFSGKLVNAFDDAPLHNGLKTVDLSLIHLSPVANGEVESGVRAPVL